ncbi:HAD family hydrolase [Nesterenkonia sp. DZ6]|uniref:HAD family hydrolase n=1 Tax=Nesterenkonia sp. DZ6 TaxID=2901229 RepID=UPI001F4CF142|nr:HAD family hydrolase [Nesterenkonia sp. DZ6]MCH8559355.1 HAD family hydrolase [Nesterenkonia sp. DZ6]
MPSTSSATVQHQTSDASAAPEALSGELQAVFWDMDGTLVDTEPYWIWEQRALVEAHGGTWSQEQAHGLVGQALSYSALMLREAGVDMTVREIIDHLITRVAERAVAEMPWRPGARELLAELSAAGVRCALVTMSEKPLAEAIVAALPAGQLEFIVSGDMVSRGKPDPEAYQQAFTRMSGDHGQRSGEPLQMSRCIAIEDSVPGVTAASDSGLVTIAVPHYTPIPADARWQTLDGLAGVSAADLERLLAR